MTAWGDFHFIRPFWLILVPVVAWIWWLHMKTTDPLRGWRRVMDQELLDAMTVGRIVNPSALNGVPFACWRELGLLVTWLLAVIAVAGPTWRPQPSPFADDPVPVMVVLKAGETMDLSDLSPSRMERARLKVADLAAARKGQPLGLVVYAGSSHLVLPPTRDTSVVATMAAEISPAIMPKPGDELTGALELANRTLGENGGSIVVIADTVSDASDRALKEFRSNHRVPVHILAVARADTPEADALRIAASSLAASVTLITPDSTDIKEIVRNTAQTPVSVAAKGEGVRWDEAGWWLTPILAAGVLLAFRQERGEDT